MNTSIATAAGKNLGYLFRARKYFLPSSLLTLYKAQINPSLSIAHISGELLPLLPCLYLMQSREGQFDLWAFDQLWHASLLNKLPSKGLPVKLCDWLADFLSGRKITVVVDGFSSSFHNINAGVPQGSVLAPTLFLLHTNDLLSSTTNPIHSFADDSTLHAGIMSNRPISVVELERRRLATAASLSKDLEAITAWGHKNMVEFNASKTQYCTLSNKRCPSEHSVLMNNQALPRSHSFKLLGVSITENMIWHEHVSSIATAAGKKLGYLFRARKYFSSNLLTLYKAQIRPSLEYCSHN
nr:unnamed protein product [Callosobruchus chinensis]